MAMPEQQAEIDKITTKPSYKEVRWMAADHAEPVRPAGDGTRRHAPHHTRRVTIACL
jgi:hypothetical protein